MDNLGRWEGGHKFGAFNKVYSFVMRWVWHPCFEASNELRNLTSWLFFFVFSCAYIFFLLLNRDGKCYHGSVNATFLGNSSTDTCKRSHVVILTLSNSHCDVKQHGNHLICILQITITPPLMSILASIWPLAPTACFGQTTWCQRSAAKPQKAEASGSSVSCICLSVSICVQLLGLCNVNN